MIDIALPPFEDIDENGKYIGNDPQFMDNVPLAGFVFPYIKDGTIKTVLIPNELVSSFFEKFQFDEPNETEMFEFLKEKE